MSAAERRCWRNGFRPTAVSIVRRMGHVQVERDGNVATVTLSNPGKKNAIPGVAWPVLESTFRELAIDPAVRCVVLTGDGDDFSSGADVGGGSADRVGSHGGDGDGEGPSLGFMRTVSRAVEALHAVPQPVVARVAGVCVGASMNLALACDVVIASEDARFSEIFARRGLTIDGGGSWILPRVVGLLKAKELALLADIIPAEEAERIGLVSRVVPRTELDATVADVAGRLAAGPPLALSMTKRLLNQSAQVTLSQAVEAEAQAQTVNLGTRDTEEAMQAFVERRPPRFEGR
jgi:enoyl-CoA hydratase/carnithine racemase